jgi:hypothetical protein
MTDEFLLPAQVRLELSQLRERVKLHFDHCSQWEEGRCFDSDQRRIMDTETNMSYFLVCRWTHTPEGSYEEVTIRRTSPLRHD